jgi:hypothetical protein
MTTELIRTGVIAYADRDADPRSVTDARGSSSGPARRMMPRECRPIGVGRRSALRDSGWPAGLAGRQSRIG